MGFVEAENVQARKAHRSRDAIAIFRKAIECRVRCDRQIHFGAENQIVEIARGDFEARDGVRERRKNRVGAGAAGNGFIEHRAPARESLALRVQIAGLVRDVVHQAHKGVERAKRVSLFLAEAEERKIKAAARGARDAIAFGVRSAHGIGIWNADDIRCGPGPD